MSTHKHIDRICVAVLALSLLLTVVFMGGEVLGIQAADKVMGYEDRLFDTSVVHTIDIVIDDWETFLSTAQSEEYSVCSVVIDGEAFKNVGIRGKGNTSLSTVSSMDSDRYSFKIEFDQYDTGKTYHGLDKLSLNNLIQDATYMKDYLTYRMMTEFGAAAPLCSFAYITVNGEDWGLYLAVEAVEEAFLQRNYGSNYGELYKPDSMNMGGGRGNGKDFNMEDFDFEATEQPQTAQDTTRTKGGRNGFSMDIDEEALRTALEEQGIDPSILDGIDLENPSMETIQQVMEQLKGVDLQALMDAVMGGQSFDRSDMGSIGGMGGKDSAMGSDDAKLQYIDDDPDSYSTIFDSAKTDVSDADQARLIESLKALGSGDVEAALDVDAVLRYFVVHNYVVNGDSYTGSMIHNYYLYEEDGKLAMIPWDYNLAFGTFQGNNATSSVNDDIDSPLSVTGSGDRPMVDWIFQSEAYAAQYHQYFSEFLETVDIQAIIDQAAVLIAPYVEKDPTAFYSYDEFQTGVETLREFCKLRSESVSNQLDSGGTVDASHLNLSDMGTMNMGGGMGGGFDQGGHRESAGDQKQQGEESTQAAQIFEGETPQMSDGTTVSEGEMSQMPGGMTMPEGEMSQMPGGMTMPEGEMSQMPGGMTMPEGEMSQIPGGMTMPEGEMSQMPGGMGGEFPGGFTQTGGQAENAAPQMPENSGMSRDFPAMENMSVPQDSSSIVLLAVCAAILLLGLLFAALFKRRK